MEGFESRIPDILLIDTTFLFFRFLTLINGKFSDFFFFIQSEIFILHGNFTQRLRWNNEERKI